VRVAVVGATGTAGTPIAAELERLGNDVRHLSRGSKTHPVDLLTGEGLDAALDGCEAVIDASNVTGSAKKARALLVEGGARLLEAEARAGVGHHVCLSIIGIDRVPIAYYGVKQEQELLVREATVPWTIVRATQFHQLVDWAFSSLARARILPRASAPLQPIDPVDVASAVAGVVAGTPLQDTMTIAGPQIQPIAELARTWKAASGKKALLLPLPLLGKAGLGLRAGGLTDPAPDQQGTVTFEKWLASRRSRS
jgi:uncharacterized protein YbjT (DUF2867 family)